jgi:hypothetical protein
MVPCHWTLDTLGLTLCSPLHGHPISDLNKIRLLKSHSRHHSFAKPFLTIPGKAWFLLAPQTLREGPQSAYKDLFPHQLVPE